MKTELERLFAEEEKWSQLARWAQFRNNFQLSRAWGRRNSSSGPWTFRFRYGEGETKEDQASDKDFAMRSF